MPISDAQRRAKAKFEAKAYDKVLLRIRNDTEPTRETITKEASKRGESLNAYIIEAIKRRIDSNS